MGVFFSPEIAAVLGGAEARAEARRPAFQIARVAEPRTPEVPAGAAGRAAFQDLIVPPRQVVELVGQRQTAESASRIAANIRAGGTTRTDRDAGTLDSTSVDALRPVVADGVQLDEQRDANRNARPTFETPAGAALRTLQAARAQAAEQIRTVAPEAAITTPTPEQLTFLDTPDLNPPVPFLPAPSAQVQNLARAAEAQGRDNLRTPRLFTATAQFELLA